MQHKNERCGGKTMMIRSDPRDPFAGPAAPARMHMVDRLKQEGAITSPAVEAAFRTIPRHLFLETFYLREQTAPVRWKQVKPSALDTLGWCQLVYADAPRITRLNEIGNPISSSSAPTIMAKTLEGACLSSGQRVLEIGAGTGYNAALLAFLVGDPAFVTTIELEDDLATLARRHLERVIGPGVHVIPGDGFLGYPPNAPYDRIVASVSTHRIPLAWLDQLGEDGILVMHLQGHLAGGCLMRFQKQGPGRSGCGQMMTGTDFMELRTPAVPSPLAPQLLTHLLHQDIACTVRFPQDQFDPTLLWDHHLAFLLQTLFPTLHLTSMRRQREDPPQICLLDDQTHTLLAFARAEDQQWNLEIRGHMQVWERVLTAYQQWVAVGRPAATAYQLHVDAVGTQRLTLPSPSSPGGKAPAWVMYDPQAGGSTLSLGWCNPEGKTKHSPRAFLFLCSASPRHPSFGRGPADCSKREQRRVPPPRRETRVLHCKRRADISGQKRQRSADWTDRFPTQRGACAG